MNKLLIITGPTATGKTKLGIELAKEFNGEIISADSQQVYVSQDEERGKDRSFPQWGLDLASSNFNVSDWVKYTIGKIRDIWERKKLPIIVGGSGQYIKELLYPSETLHIPPDEKLRSKNYELRELQNRLKKINKNKWELMNDSDRKNPRRLVRAIEVARNEKILEPASTRGEPPRMTADCLVIGLIAPKEVIYQKIMIRRRNRPDLVAKEFRLAKKQLAYLKKYLPGIQWFDVNGDQPAKIRQIFSRWRGNN